jgi:hypothetical protein
MNGALACTAIVSPDEIPATRLFEKISLSQTSQGKEDRKLIDCYLRCWNNLKEKFSGSKTTAEFSVAVSRKTFQTEESVSNPLPREYVQIERLMRKDVVLRECPAVYRTLEVIRQLKPDWDTYGAPAISGDIIDLAYSVVFDIKRTAEAMGRRLPEPFVAPGSGGSIQLEWQFGGKEFELEIIPSDNQPRYAYLLCPEPASSTWKEGEFTMSPHEHPVVNSFLSWI